MHYPPPMAGSLSIGLSHHVLHRLPKHAHGRQSAPLELERPHVALLRRHRERHVDRLLCRHHLAILAGHHLRLALTRYRGGLSLAGILCHVRGFGESSPTRSSCLGVVRLPKRAASSLCFRASASC